jgi:hypothetical protein
MSPFDPTVATETGAPYTLTGKGRLMSVLQSSQWLPVSVPPGVIVPVVVVVVYSGGGQPCTVYIPEKAALLLHVGV